jgi:hypothetical protein
VTRLSKPDYVMAKLLYFLGRFSPDQRMAFMRRALVEVGKLPGGYGVDLGEVPSAGPVDPQSALPAPEGPARRHRIRRSSP